MYMDQAMEKAGDGKETFWGELERCIGAYDNKGRGLVI